MGKQSVDFYRRCWATDFLTDMITGNGFVISEPPEINLDGSKQKSMYGPQSPLYGTSYEDEQAFIERYRCECPGDMGFKGRQFEGEICPICHKPVKERGSDINTTGWIVLGNNNRIINPYYFKILQSTIGKTVFNDIVVSRKRITKNGQSRSIEDGEGDIVKTSPYAGIGIDKFYNDYEEILTYFKGIKKNKEEAINSLLHDKYKVFTSFIPIASTLLRPQSSTADTFYYQSIDKLINTAWRLSENLKVCVDVEREYILYRLQTKVNGMWDNYFDTLNGKEGHIRGELLGGSLGVCLVSINAFNCGELSLGSNY